MINNASETCELDLLPEWRGVACCCARHSSALHRSLSGQEGTLCSQPKLEKLFWQPKIKSSDKHTRTPGNGVESLACERSTRGSPKPSRTRKAPFSKSTDLAITLFVFSRRPNFESNSGK